MKNTFDVCSIFVALLITFPLLGHSVEGYSDIAAKEQVGGRFWDAVHGDPLYVAQGSRILTFTSDGDSGLVLRHSTPPAPGAIVGVTRSDNLLYAAWRSQQYGQVRIFDLDEHGHPQYLKDFDFRDDESPDWSLPAALVAHQQMLYLTGEGVGVVALDISDPLAPVVGERASAGAVLGGGLKVWGEGKLLSWTVVGGVGVTPVLNVLDISNPHAPRRLSRYWSSVDHTHDFQVVAGHDYAVMLSGKDVVDLSVPGAPRRMSGLLGYASEWGYLEGDILLGGYDGAIRPWDLRDLPFVFPLDPVSAPADGTSLIARGPGVDELTFFTDSGKVLTVGIADATRPDLLAVDELLPGTEVNAVASIGSHAALIDQDGRVQLFSADMSPLGMLEPASSDDVFRNVAIRGDQALLLSDEGLHTADLGNPDQPELIGSVEIESLRYGARVVMDETRVWISAHHRSRLIEANLDDPAIPQLVHVLELDSHPGRLARQGQYLYLVLRLEERLAVFRTDPDLPPEEVGSYECAGIRTVDVHDDIAVVNCRREWRFLDVSSPESPQLLGTYPDPTSFPFSRPTHLESQQAWVTTANGVELLDIANPAEPFLLARYTLPGRPTELSMADPGMWVALGEGGLALLEPPDSVMPVQTAAWYNPDRAGEGWLVELLADDEAVGYWYTYDEDGNQRWLIGTGEVRGNRIVFQMEAVSGGRFGAQFDPDEVEYAPAGQVRMMWTGCDRGWFEYLPEGEEEMALGLERLTRTQGLNDCGGLDDSIDTAPANQSGSWYDPAQTGQGFTLHWLHTGDALVKWFTFDDQGNPYWMLGVGQAEGDAIVFPEINATRGASFGADFDPDDVELFHWGTLQMQLDCLTGTAEYASELPEFGSGSFELERLSVPEGFSCD